MWSSCACRTVVRIGTSCPSCGSRVGPGPTAAAALLGLQLAGCWTKNVPLYGVEITDHVVYDSTPEETGLDPGDSAATADTGTR